MILCESIFKKHPLGVLCNFKFCFVILGCVKTNFNKAIRRPTIRINWFKFNFEMNSSFQTNVYLVLNNVCYDWCSWSDLNNTELRATFDWIFGHWIVHSIAYWSDNTLYNTKFVYDLVTHKFCRSNSFLHKFGISNWHSQITTINLTD